MEGLRFRPWGLDLMAESLGFRGVGFSAEG